MATFSASTRSSYPDLKVLRKVPSLLPQLTCFHRVLCANRGEIAVRVFRACAELGIQSVAIYSKEDHLQLHRYKASQSFLVGKDKSPVGAYLAIDEIIALAKREEVDAIHPGYGFLSEREEFARACEEAGIVFIGPSADTVAKFGDKVAARKLARECGVPVVPGTEGPVGSVDDAIKFCEEFGFPIMIKASMGGGGRGMRVVRAMSELKENFERASSEALAAFGDGTVFIERLVEKPRHIEIQLLADGKGNVVHLFERDCSLQRRHQKVIEIAPAMCLPAELRDRIAADAVKLARHVGYRNAGTAEFLVDAAGNYYFIEVNPRIQVEHTITEEITGVDLVQSQIMIAAGRSLADLGLEQENITIRGHAIQCRVTTENPTLSFQPETGRITVYRSPSGFGIRLDGSQGFTGSVISAHYDSLLVKITARDLSFAGAVRRLLRALAEIRIKGVGTNVKFLRKLLSHPKFSIGLFPTDFIDHTPELFQYEKPRYVMQKLLQYLGQVIVNGCPTPGDSEAPLPKSDPLLPPLPAEMLAVKGALPGWRSIFLREGPEAFAKAVRAHKSVLLMDTTWRDAHQSLLATRMRTMDMANIAEYTSYALRNCFSLEMWGGATFDVCLRFLGECPWDRLKTLRRLVPNIPFQMLLRGANAVGYTAYPDNVVYEFVKKAKDWGIDVFRVFDSLNYMDNMRLGIDAVKKAGGIIEAAICYTGDVSNPHKTKYTLDYYLDFARELVAAGIHILCIKDMAGLLKPAAATLLVGALRKEFPDVPIHVHTHDTAGTGVATYIACVDAGADVVDVATDSMSGTTSQPSMGAFVACLANTDRAAGIDLQHIQDLSEYWDGTRQLYAPFEANTLKSGSSSVYDHEMPGGQYTNLQFQSIALGLAGQWTQLKVAYSEANMVLGDIIKVTPSSKVVGDLAQFMVANKLNRAQVEADAATLNFPTSVIEFLQGYLGIPFGGFPEPFRTNALRGRPTVSGRPGASMKPIDLDELRQQLQLKYGEHIRDVDALSAALYPKVFDEFETFWSTYSNVAVLPTRYFLRPLPMSGDEVELTLGPGMIAYVRFAALGEVRENGYRQVHFEINGQQRFEEIRDTSAVAVIPTNEKASGLPGSIACPMTGVVVELCTRVGATLHVGDKVAVLSAMKMETVIASPVAGKVKRLPLSAGTAVMQGDLVCEIEARSTDPRSPQDATI